LKDKTAGTVKNGGVCICKQKHYVSKLASGSFRTLALTRSAIDDGF